MPPDSIETRSPANIPTEIDPIERIILRSMNEGVITIECDGTIHTVNPAASRILGLEKDTLCGKRIEDAFPVESDNREFVEVFARLINEGVATARREVIFTRPDGQQVDLSIATAFLRIDECIPELQNAVAVFRDITAFKSLERAKRRAVNHLSHELQTPLAIIEASVGLLAEKSEANASTARVVDRIRRNLQRLKDIQEIVEEITNPREFYPQPFDIREVMEALLNEIRSAAAHRSVAIRTQLEVERVEYIDPDLFRLVVSTLVRNAIENSPDGSDVLVSIEETSSALLLKGEDHGIGIPLADQEFIFEGFHHTQSTDEYSSKRPYDFNAGGKGLELLRLKMLAEAGWFDISFVSERCRFIPTSVDHCPGNIVECPHVSDVEACRKSGGTTFSVAFPRKRVIAAV
ncbi:MAG: PAS domain S-box protein [Desulfomonile sp.]|nr:PAS domain S-box protein [Desulfomonile sp.]